MPRPPLDPASVCKCMPAQPWTACQERGPTSVREEKAEPPIRKYVSGLCWIRVRHVLEICWKCDGNVSGMCRGCVGSVLETCWEMCLGVRSSFKQKSR